MRCILVPRKSYDPATQPIPARIREELFTRTFDAKNFNNANNLEVCLTEIPALLFSFRCTHYIPKLRSGVSCVAWSDLIFLAQIDFRQ